jgi:hypothetical protein
MRPGAEGVRQHLRDQCLTASRLSRVALLPQLWQAAWPCFAQDIVPSVEDRVQPVASSDSCAVRIGAGGMTISTSPVATS